ncbi:MAG: Membrane protein involved in the export of O-antigen and teichoic acid [Acidobacteriales bacterium]|nr:Membrane protein involved in the export of O-antigen and teichoic acid [Terriglobales bacterium]
MEANHTSAVLQQKGSVALPLECGHETQKSRFSFTTNTAILMASQLARYGLTLATWAVIARLLGAKALGEVQIAYLLPSWLLLSTNFGLPLSNIYFLGRRTYSLPQILGNLFLRWLIESCLIVVVMFLARGLVLKFIAIDPSIYPVIIAWIPLQILNSYFTSILTAQMRFFEQFWINIAQGVAVISIVLMAVVYFHGGTKGAITGLVIATAIVVAMQLLFLREGLKARLMPQWELVRDCFQFGLRGYFANLAQFVTYRLDSFIVSYYLGVAALGIYAAAYTAAEMLFYLPSSFATVVFPATASSTIEEANWRTARVSRLSISVVFFGAVVGAVISPWVFANLFRGQFKQSVVLFWILLPGVVLLASTKIHTADLLGRGFPQYASRGSVGGMIGTAILDVWLIPAHGLIAAAAISTAVYACQTVYYVSCLHRVTGLTVEDLFLLTGDDVRLASGVLSNKTYPLLSGIRSLLPN